MLQRHSDDDNEMRALLCPHVDEQTKLLPRNEAWVVLGVDDCEAIGQVVGRLRVGFCGCSRMRPEVDSIESIESFACVAASSCSVRTFVIVGWVAPLNIEIVLY